MSQNRPEPDETVDRASVRRGQVLVSATVHFTGGIRAERAQNNLWCLHPVKLADRVARMRPLQLGQLVEALKPAGIEWLGGDEISDLETPLPARRWRPLPILDPDPADAWAAIAHHARRAGASEDARLARNISVSLRAASIRLRDASDQYHLQLANALEHGPPPGHLFSNIQITDLHLAFHSLLSEMASARDYIACVAGRRVGAPARIDALSRLREWILASSRSEARSDPVIQRLLAESHPAPGSWLLALGEYRNLMLHREPLGASGDAELRICEHPLGELVVPAIEMRIAAVGGKSETTDALVRFLDLFRSLQSLATFVADASPFEQRPPVFGIR